MVQFFLLVAIHPQLFEKMGYSGDIKIKKEERRRKKEKYCIV
ncbi:MAG: hypothetical protein SWX82_19185 [Cyanobacteriota bacterium]|nr:hypothetical protein [Cyanobacteriota bacterium]